MIEENIYVDIIDTGQRINSRYKYGCYIYNNYYSMICFLLGLWYSRHFVVSMAEDQRRGCLVVCLFVRSKISH